jgi:hypothetical protein
MGIRPINWDEAVAGFNAGFPRVEPGGTQVLKLDHRDDTVTLGCRNHPMFRPSKWKEYYEAMKKHQRNNLNSPCVTLYIPPGANYARIIIAYLHTHLDKLHANEPPGVPPIQMVPYSVAMYPTVWLAASTLGLCGSPVKGCSTFEVLEKLRARAARE